MSDIADKIWDELYRELQPEIPFDKAKTVRMVMEETGIGENPVRDRLKKKVKEDGWNEVLYKGKLWYWPPDEQK